MIYKYYAKVPPFFILFLIVFHSCGNLLGQPLQAWFGPIYNYASYKDYRVQEAYNKGVGNPEIYNNIGVYANIYDGSLLGMMFSDSRVMLGDYIKIGIGGGYVSSKSYSHIQGDGSVYLWQGGVYGEQSVVSPGPISKTRATYIMDLNLGLQLQGRIDDDFYLGFRYFMKGQLNMIVHRQDYRYNGVLGFFGRYYDYGVVVEYTLNRSKQKYTKGSVTSFSGKYYPWEDYDRFLGFKIELANEDIYHGSYNIRSPAKYHSFSLFYGFELSMKK